MATPFAAYRGDEPYVFVCYAHDDSDVVYPEIESMHEQGVKLWYDEGIAAGKVWRAEIAEALRGCSKFLYYISTRSLESDHCNREINLALEERKEVVPVYLESVELTSDLRLGLVRLQALHRYSDDRYQQHLLDSVGHIAVPEKTPSIIRKKPTTGKPTWFLYAGLGFVLAVLSAGGWWYQSEFTSAPDPILLTAPVMGVVVGVEPFDDLSGLDRPSSWARVVTDNVVSAFSQIKPLRTIPLKESYPAGRPSLDYVVRGSIRPRGSTAQISIQLVESGSSRVLWTEELEPEIVEGKLESFEKAPYVAQTMFATILAYRIGATMDTDNEEARSLVIQGALEVQSRTMLRGGDPGAAILKFKRAIELDPNLAPAYAWLASMYAIAPEASGIEGEEERSRLAHENVQRAIQLAPDLYHNYFVLAQVKINLDGDLEAGRQYLEKARLLSGVTSGATGIIEMSIGNTYLEQGNFEQAIVHYRTALAIGAGLNQSAALLNLGKALNYTGRHEEALEVLDQSAKMDGTRSSFSTSSGASVLVRIQNAIAYKRLGSLDAAQREVDAIVRRIEKRFPFHTPGSLALVGRDEEARKVLEQLEERYASGDHFPGWNVFVAYFYLGDLDSAFRWLNRVIENHEIRRRPRLYGVEFASLRDDPRYQAALQRIDDLAIRR